MGRQGDREDQGCSCRGASCAEGGMTSKHLLGKPAAGERVTLDCGVKGKTLSPGSPGGSFGVKFPSVKGTSPTSGQIKRLGVATPSVKVSGLRPLKTQGGKRSPGVPSPTMITPSGGGLHCKARREPRRRNPQSRAFDSMAVSPRAPDLDRLPPERCSRRPLSLRYR